MNLPLRSLALFPPSSTGCLNVNGSSSISMQKHFLSSKALLKIWLRVTLAGSYSLMQRSLIICLCTNHGIQGLVDFTRLVHFYFHALCNKRAILVCLVECFPKEKKGVTQSSCLWLVLVIETDEKKNRLGLIQPQNGHFFQILTITANS